MNISAAIEQPRVHNQIVPLTTMVEVGPEGSNKEVMDDLKARGHNITEFDINLGISEGASRCKALVFSEPLMGSASDHRRERDDLGGERLAEERRCCRILDRLRTARTDFSCLSANIHLLDLPTFLASMLLLRGGISHRPAIRSSDVSEGANADIAQRTSLPKKKRQPMGEVYLLLIWCNVLDSAGGPQKKTPQSVSGCLLAMLSNTRSHCNVSFAPITGVAAHVRPAEVGRSAEVGDRVLFRADILDEKVVHLVLAARQLEESHNGKLTRSWRSGICGSRSCPRGLPPRPLEAGSGTLPVSFSPAREEQNLHSAEPKSRITQTK